MKRALLIICMLGMVGGAFAQDCYWLGDIKTTLDMSFFTKYMFYGTDVYDDRPAFQPSIRMDYGCTGLSTTVWYSTPTTSGDGALGIGSTALSEFDYAVNYENSFWEGCQNQVDYNLGYRFRDFYNWNHTNAQRKSLNINFYEVTMDFEMPNVWGCGLVPHYMATYIAPYKTDNGLNDDMSGWLHTVGLKYNTSICCPFRNVEQPLLFSVDAVYNDGAIYGALDQSHDWQYVTFGLQAPIAMGCGTLTPSVYYQMNLDSFTSDLNNDTEEVYAGLTYSVSF